MHIQIKWEPMLWLSMLPSWKQLSYLPIKRFRISPVMSCPSLSRIKTRAVRASAVSPAQGLPTVRWADAGMIMPSPGLMSLSKSSPTAVVSHASLSGPALNAWLRCFFFCFFFAAIWNSNPIEPRLCSDSFGLPTCICKRTERGWVARLYWCSEHSFSTVSGRFDIFHFFFKTIFAVLWFLPFAVFHPKGMLLYQMAFFFSVRELSSRKLSLWLKWRYTYKTNHSFFKVILL